MSSNNVNNGFIKIDNKKINKSEKQKFELENNLLITRKNSLLNHELSKRYNLIQSINKSNIVDGLTKKQIDLFNTSPKIERLNKLISSNKNMSNEKKMNNTQKKLSIKISKSEKSIDNLMKNNSKPIIKVNPLTQRNDEFSVKKVTRNFFRNKLDLNNTKREFFNPLNQTIEKIKNRNKKSEIIINEIKQIGKIEFLKTKCVGLHYTISQKEFDDYLHSLIVERQKEFEELNKAKIDKKITPKNLEIKPEKIQKEKKKNNIINLQNFDYEEREIIVNKDETPTNSTKSCVKSKIIEIKNNVDLNEKLKAKPKKINKKKNNVLVTKCPLIYYLNSLKNTRKFISLEFKIIKKNKKQLRNHSTKKLQSISIASSFILTDRQKHTLNANTLIKKMHTIYNFNDDNNLINKEINKKRKIMLFKGKLTKSEMLLSKIINDSSDNDISFINLYNYANERYNNHLNNKESGLSNLSGQLINQKYKKINKSKLNVKNFLKDKSLSPIKTFNSPKISTKNLENNSKKSSEFDSEDNQSIEKLQVIKVEPINNNQLKKNYAYENLDFLEPYLCDENSKEINKLIYKGKELDILKVLEKNKLLIVKRINPNFNKTNDVFLTLKRLTKSQKSDIDIILEFIEQKIDELDEKFKNFNAHRLKYDYEKNTFPLFEKEFNKLFKDYPKIVRDFMKERYMLKFGNPFKNPVLMFRMSEALTRNKKINPPTILSNREKTKTDKIMEKNDILNKAKVNEKFRIIGNMKILDVPEIFKKLDETKPTIIREKQLKKTENIRHKKYFHNLSGTNFFKNPILKNYNSLMQSFDVIQDQNIINHNKICKIQTFYKERSMYVDPRVCVLDQRKYEKIK